MNCYLAEHRVCSYILDLDNFSYDEVAYPLHAYAPANAYEALVANDFFSVGIQRIVPESFRLEMSIFSSRAEWNAVTVEPISEASSHWQYVAELRSRFNNISTQEQILVVRLLAALGFHSDVVNLTPRMVGETLKDDLKCQLAFARCVSQIALHADYDQSYDIDALQNIIKYAPARHLDRFRAAHALVVYASKETSFKELAREAGDVMRSSFDSLRIQSPLSENLLLSRLYRGTSMVPLMDKKADEVVEQMNLAESYAREAMKLASSRKEMLLARENLMTVMESRAKEALFLGDVDLAKVRVDEQVKLDPLDPKNHIESAEVSMQSGHWSEALKSYRTAATLGAPGRPIALFMAGQAAEKLDDLSLAADFYYRSLEADELGISPLQRLKFLEAKLKDSFRPDFLGWINRRANELENE